MHIYIYIYVERMHITNRNSYVRVSVSLGGKKNKLLEQFNVTMRGSSFAMKIPESLFHRDRNRSKKFSKSFRKNKLNFLLYFS